LLPSILVLSQCGDRRQDLIRIDLGDDISVEYHLIILNAGRDLLI